MNLVETNFVEQLTAIAILIDFLFGVTFGIIGGAILGSRREDYEKTMLGEAPDPLSAGARVIHGVFTRDDGYLRSLLHSDSEAIRNDGTDDGSGSQGPGLDR
jgi:hypothetical protein